MNWTENTATDRPPIIISAVASTITIIIIIIVFFHANAAATSLRFFLSIFDIRRNSLFFAAFRSASQWFDKFNGEAFSLQFFHSEFVLRSHATRKRENDKRWKAGANMRAHTNLYTKMWLIIFFCAFIFPAYYLTAMVEVSTFYSLKQQKKRANDEKNEWSRASVVYTNCQRHCPITTYVIVLRCCFFSLHFFFCFQFFGLFKLLLRLSFVFLGGDDFHFLISLRFNCAVLV